MTSKNFKNLNFSLDAQPEFQILNWFYQYPDTMAISVDELSNGVYKIGKMFALKSTYPKEFFKFWELG